MASSDVFLSNMVSGWCPYSQRILELSLPHVREHAWEGIAKKTVASAWKKLWSERVVECDTEESEIASCGTYSQRDCVCPRFGEWRWI
ncbi:hypothetical protein AVEN_106073-1 [Araneus ventricosus]|uniref:Uncharacterized protein n=1 Tax=Araneus ventricosus TaxID=182803 RepID=A0A4Y2UBC0_ARAVE|nr:hypothetical protein AVEN_106073-1 [Araneus ventricosus]